MPNMCETCILKGEAMRCKAYALYIAALELKRSLPLIGEYVSDDVDCKYYEKRTERV